MTAFQKAEALAGQRYDPRQAALAGSRGHNAVPHAESLRTIEDAEMRARMGAAQEYRGRTKSVSFM
jgi:hypothetical protein